MRNHERIKARNESHNLITTILRIYASGVTTQYGIFILLACCLYELVQLLYAMLVYN